MLGLGNVLLRDEGVGVHVIRQLQEVLPPDDAVSLVDGGTLGLELMPYLEEAERVIIVDAMSSDMPPGTVTVLAGEQAWRWRIGTATAHELGLPSVLALASLRGWRPEKMAVVGVQPECLGPGLEMSRAVKRGAAEAVKAVMNLLLDWQTENTIGEC